MLTIPPRNAAQQGDGRGVAPTVMNPAVPASGSDDPPVISTNPARVRTYLVAPETESSHRHRPATDRLRQELAPTYRGTHPW